MFGGASLNDKNIPINNERYINIKQIDNYLLHFNAIH